MSSAVQSTEASITGASAPTVSLPHVQPREARAASRRPRFGTLRTVLLALLVAGALVWGGRFALQAYRYEETDDAYVAGHLHQISTQVDGQVQEVLVRENQTVHAGDVLLRLDPLEFQIALQKSAASVAQAQAQAAENVAAAAQAEAALAEAHARVTQAEAQLEQAGAQFALAKLTLSRNEQLFSHGGAVTQADVDAARTAFQAGQAANNAAQANVTAARAAVGSAESARASVHAQADAARANIAAAEAAQRDAQRQLTYATVVAPADGRVGNKHVESGDRVQAGQALLALAEPTTWITANFKETQLARMHTGQPVEFTIDALPDQKLHGTLDSLSPASGAQFTLLPPDNATGNFNKVVQRVPVKIIPDAASQQQVGEALRLGLSAVVDVRIR